MAEVWFDRRDGSMLIGEAAVMPRLEESLPGDVLPLPDLLLAKDFPIGSQEFPKVASQEWDRDRVVALGTSLVKMFQKSGHPRVALTIPILQRLYWLGLCPENSTLRRRIDMHTLRQEAGSPAGQGIFDSWTTEDFANYAARVEQYSGGDGPPSTQDYLDFSRQHPGTPTIKIISKHFEHGVSSLNTLLGYVYVNSWDEDDFIDFGVRYLKANGMSMFKQAGIIALAARRKGPSYQTIVRKFGWKKYRQRVTEAHERDAAASAEARGQKLASYRALVADGSLPAHCARFSDEQLLRYGSHYRLVTHLFPDLSEVDCRQAVRAAISSPSLVETILSLDTSGSLTAVRLEQEARALDIHGDLWPATDQRSLHHLKVSQADITAVQSRRNAQLQDWKRRRRMANSLSAAAQ